MSLRTARIQAKARARLVAENFDEYRALYQEEVGSDGPKPRRQRAQSRAVTRLTKLHPGRYRTLYKEEAVKPK